MSGVNLCNEVVCLLRRRICFDRGALVDAVGGWRGLYLVGLVSGGNSMHRRSSSARNPETKTRWPQQIPDKKRSTPFHAIALLSQATSVQTPGSQRYTSRLKLPPSCTASGPGTVSVLVHGRRHFQTPPAFLRTLLYLRKGVDRGSGGSSRSRLGDLCAEATIHAQHRQGPCRLHKSGLAGRRQ